MDEKGLTPRQIVERLNQFIIGQDRAKKLVAIALRNRARRRCLSDDLKEEVFPKNIIMIGPTGVGKTEIARRLSKLAQAPFVKVEATKYTEVGYVGRDVESMIRDLTEVAVNMVRDEKTTEIRNRAEERAHERLMDLVLPPPPNLNRSIREKDKGTEVVYDFGDLSQEEKNRQERWLKSRQKLEQKLNEGKMEDREVELDVQAQSGPMVEIFTSGGAGLEEMGIDVRGLFEKMVPKKNKRIKTTIREARDILVNEEIEKMLEMDKVIKEALNRVQESGIVFIDELDKVAGRSSTGHGPDVSREGVQRDLLPIVEGSQVFTKYGMVSTDHILFIAAGAFHQTKPSDLIPELQGRFPLRVELNDLGVEEYRRILTEPQNALTKQYTSLLSTEGVRIVFEPDGVDEIAQSAYEVNQRTENIGARRLYTVMEKIL
ncbi:ATP-dependent protease ATPase subunit HslU, partial [Candidatus Sumerlaeota bacterium]|nr:ATP-dependent protease ATPase subunit HslU [Candidatus Sumerlaeota bacterium]